MEETAKEQIYEFGKELSEYLTVEAAAGFLIKIFMCLIIIIISMALIKIFNGLVKKLIYSHNGFSERKAKTLNTVCRSVVKYIIYFFAFCQILSVFGINVMSFIAVAGVGSIAIAFGAQSLVQDIISGMFILLEDQFAVGDMVTIENYSGIVEGIGIRTTRLRSNDGNLFIIPNGSIKIITNMSKEFNRAVIDISVAYEENVDKVIEVMKDEMKSIFEKKLISGIIKEPSVLGVVELGESAVVIRISADSAVGENWAIERELRRFIKNRFDKENICIPYPQLVLHKGDMTEDNVERGE